ncbi:PREDICTED: mediator of RNA polymerase II transcription subunit 28 [Tarenaya hassleriana]|uniref:mediator of RNA polymerase II transcription subunit 28 n=1 Tax=Tarenaya hassleriana TaxID=28532 RepID=UPI00053C91E6|nr:PREDICTED: mediator of RNA polymerase II transcription subunit 28 [Tarenaya hassleriana]
MAEERDQAMADHQQPPPPADPPPPMQSPPRATTPTTPANNQNQEMEEMLACVTALEAALLPCLPARELQAIDRSPHPSHQIDVERHARDFMEAAKKLHLYFISLKREDPPTRAETLRKEIAGMEEELKTKIELIKKHERLIQDWRKEIKEQLDKHRIELERV